MKASQKSVSVSMPIYLPVLVIFTFISLWLDWNCLPIASDKVVRACLAVAMFVQMVMLSVVVWDACEIRKDKGQ